MRSRGEKTIIVLSIKKFIAIKRIFWSVTARYNYPFLEVCLENPSGVPEVFKTVFSNFQSVNFSKIPARLNHLSKNVVFN